MFLHLAMAVRDIQSTANFVELMRWSEKMKGQRSFEIARNSIRVRTGLPEPYKMTVPELKNKF
jgi:hypothetical protein